MKHIFSQVNYLAGIQHGVLTYGTRIGPSDFIGLHLFYLNSGLMEVTTELFPDGTGEDFSVMSMAARATYAKSYRSIKSRVDCELYKRSNCGNFNAGCFL